MLFSRLLAAFLSFHSSMLPFKIFSLQLRDIKELLMVQLLYKPQLQDK
jgi:hypothetical protein